MLRTLSGRCMREQVIIQAHVAGQSQDLEIDLHDEPPPRFQVVDAPASRFVFLYEIFDLLFIHGCPYLAKQNRPSSCGGPGGR